MANLLLEQFETEARVYDELYEMPDILSPMYAEDGTKENTNYDDRENRTPGVDEDSDMEGSDDRI
jgi:hypothetical protein